MRPSWSIGDGQLPVNLPEIRRRTLVLPTAILWLGHFAWVAREGAFFEGGVALNYADLGGQPRPAFGRRHE